MDGFSEIDYTNTPASEKRTHFLCKAESIDEANLKVSIVTPFFNTGPIFRETVISVLRQSWQGWEWIIVNDGSSDPASLSELFFAAEKDRRIRVIHFPENRGLSAARNCGLREARGEFICWLDSDDLLETTFIEKCLWRLNTTECLAFTKGFSIGFGANEYLWRHGFHDRERFLKENRVDPTSLMRISVAREIGGFDETIQGGLEDWDFWLRAAHFGYWGDTIAEPLNWYRRRISHLDRWENLTKVSLRENMEETFRRKYPGLWSVGFPKPYRLNAVANEKAASVLVNPLKKTGRRILAIFPHLELGGADRFNLDLLQQLGQRFNWEFTVLTTRRSEDRWQKQFFEMTDDVFMMARFLPTSAFTAFVEYIIESRQPDVVYLSHSEFGYSILPWLKKAFPELSIIDVVHIVMEEWKSGGFPNFSRLHGEELFATVAISKDLKEWLVNKGRIADSIAVVHCNVDTAYWSRLPPLTESARGRWDLPADRLIIVYAARFCAQKNPTILPRIIEELTAEKLEYVLVLAGEGPDLKWIEEHVCRPFSKKVKLVGPLARKEMRDLLSVADVLLLPSRSEGIALILYEAMSMNVVPVATDVGGQRELVTGECGFLFPLTNELAQNCADAIAQIARNPELKKKMGDAGRERVQSLFDLETMGEKMNEIFSSAIRSCSEPLRSRASPLKSIDLVSHIEHLYAEDKVSDEWSTAVANGKSIFLFVTWMAAFLRRTPFRRALRRFEIQYGQKLGSWLIRFSR